MDTVEVAVFAIGCVACLAFLRRIFVCDKSESRVLAPLGCFAAFVSGVVYLFPVSPHAHGAGAFHVRLVVAAVVSCFVALAINRWWPLALPRRRALLAALFGVAVWPVLLLSAAALAGGFD